MGGCRMMRYGTFNEALSDVLRLSKGMTYKNIMAGLPYGGGNVGRIAGMLHELFVRADAEKLPSSMVADAMAQERLGAPNARAKVRDR
jgi:glutamate dehydrogenase/leucine dehydrogenase